MLKTPLCHQIGIDYPIFSAGMGPAAGPELTAAVSNAGGCGVMGGLFLPPPILRQAIHKIRRLTDKPFGVNFVLTHLQPGQIEVCLEEQVPLLVLFWGDPSSYVALAHRHKTQVFSQVGSVAEAIAAHNAGVDAIVVQGIEAGGHVKSRISLSTIVPVVVEAVPSVPVIAAGGIATGRGVVQGDMESVALYAGESCSLVHDIKPAAQIVRDVVREAEAAIANRCLEQVATMQR